MDQARAARPRGRPEGTVPSHRRFLYREDGAEGIPNEVSPTRRSYADGARACRLAGRSKNVDIVILSGLTDQYDVEVRMLESSSDWPTRESFERAVIDQNKWLQMEQPEYGAKAAPVATSEPRRTALCVGKRA